VQNVIAENTLCLSATLHLFTCVCNVAKCSSIILHLVMHNVCFMLSTVSCTVCKWHCAPVFGCGDGLWVAGRGGGVKRNSKRQITLEESNIAFASRRPCTKAVDLMLVAVGASLALCRRLVHRNNYHIGFTKQIELG
jgi:hypothetical protein